MFKLGVVLLGCAALLAAFLAARSDHGLPHVGSSQASDERPNVLLIVTDDQRYDQLKVMPKTRRFFRLGTRYVNAYATTPLCCPGRASILSGRYAHNHDVLSNTDAWRFNPKLSIQAELARAGYATALFGKYMQGIKHPLPFFRRSHTGYGADLRYSDRLVARRSLRFLREQERRDEEPWFLVFSARAPHAPHLVPRRYRRLRLPRFVRTPAHRESIADKPQAIRKRSRRQRKLRKTPRQIWRGQLRMLAFLDDQLARVYRFLRRRGELENTLVIFISDNGYLLGEHRLVRKGPPYQESVRVPLLVRYDRLDLARRDERLAANIDLAPTIFEAAGIEPAYEPDGRSLWGGERDWALTEHRTKGFHWRAYRDQEIHLIEHYSRTGELAVRELYDLVQDPLELANIFHRRPKYTDDRVEAAQAALAAAADCQAAGCP